MCDVLPDFTGRTAVVTGGSRGIGAGIAIALAQRRARVVVSGRDQAALAGVVRAIVQAGGQARSIADDITDQHKVVALRAEAERIYGHVSLLVACAGGGGMPKPLVEESADGWRTTLDNNLTSAFLTLKTFLPPMMQTGDGSIVMMSSAAGRQLSSASTSYAAAKAGLLALTRQAAAEAAPYGVRVNAVAPSAIITDRLAQAPASVREEIARGFPLRRLGEVTDVVNSVLFLLGQHSAWITGITLDVAGGKVMI